jgi:hypothetical protein
MKIQSKLWKLLALTPLAPLITGCVAAVPLMIMAVPAAMSVAGAYKNGAVSIELNEAELKQATSQKFGERLQKLAIWPTSMPSIAATMGAADVSLAESLRPSLSDMKVLMLSPSQTTRELKKLNIDSSIEGKTSEDVIADIETLCKAAELDLVIVPRWIVSYGQGNMKDAVMSGLTFGMVAAKQTSKANLLFYGCRTKTQSTVTGQVSVEMGMRSPGQSEVAQSVGVVLGEAVANILGKAKG